MQLVAINSVIIILILFVAYWLANQGFFSALLHLLCVIVAGAVALAFWEPLTTRLLLRGTGFDSYAWGVALVGLFVVSLLILRILSDKLVPNHIELVRGADLVFGFAAGLAAAVLTFGIIIIGIGFISSKNDIFGFRGWGRDDRTARIVEINSLWVPVHRITSEFYEWLSVTSFAAPQPLRHCNPDLYKQASLVRDSFSNGRGMLSLKPSEATVKNLYEAIGGAQSVYLLEIQFGNGARDYGDQLTLSSAQIRLIGYPDQHNRLAKPDVVHPVAWTQYSGYHKFDATSHYITSVPARETVEVAIEFRTSRDFQPRFVQIRNTLYSLPAPRAAPAGVQRGLGALDQPSQPPTALPVTGGSIQAVVSVSNDIRPISANSNQLPGTIEVTDERMLSRGKALFRRGGPRPAPKLRVMGIHEPQGARCVRIDISRGGPADIFAVMQRVAADARLVLLTRDGGEFSPIGYFYSHADGTEVMLDPQKRIQSIDKLPIPPTTGNQKLELLFHVTEGATVVGLRYGDIDIGSCNLLVPKQ